MKPVPWIKPPCAIPDLDTPTEDLGPPAIQKVGVRIIEVPNAKHVQRARDTGRFRPHASCRECGHPIKATGAGVFCSLCGSELV